MTVALLNNRYQIVQTLGRGGFGETFLAIDTNMPSARKCVIKQLNPVVQGPSIPDWLKDRFQREAAVLEELGENHAQIPRLYAYFTQDGDFYLVQEWIQGATLTETHHQQGNFSSQQVQQLLIQILPILDYIHSRRIIHRDIKPDNIIIRASDRLPVLIDFGVIKEAMATVVHPDGKSAYSVALGTPGYMASEQAAGRPVYSSDLYSLGLTAVFLLTGKTPQALETDSRTGEILWREQVPDLHSHLATVIDRAIRFHPRERFSTAQEMLVALQTATEPQTQATLVVSPGQHLAPKKVSTEQTHAVTLAPEETRENGGLRGVLVSLLVGGIMAGAFAFGFITFLSKQGSRPVTDPSPVFSSEPQTFPTPESKPSEIQPQPTPQAPIPSTPSNPVIPSPSEEVTPSPTESVTPSPSEEVTPSPTESVTPSPSEEVTPSPTESVTPSPSEEVTPTPNTPPPVTSPTPTPNTPPPVTPQPTPTPEQNTQPEVKQQNSSLKIPDEQKLK